VLSVPTATDNLASDKQILMLSKQRQKYTKTKGKTAPEKYNVVPDITRRGAKNVISSNNYENLMNLMTRSSCQIMF